MPAPRRGRAGTVCGTVCGAALFLAVSHAAAQVPERGAALLGVDFIVTAADGTVIRDLRHEEVRIRIDGRARPVRSLQLISVAPGGGARRPAALPPPFGDNATSEAGRRLVLVLDDNSFRPGREGPLRDAVSRMIGRLGSRDLLSLVTMPYGGIKVPLTTDHGRVRAAMRMLVGQADADTTGSDLACRSRRTLESLVGYLDGLGIRDTPTTVMFVSAAMSAPRRDAPVTMAPGMCELPTELYREVGVAAGAARAQFYVIQPEAIMVHPGATRPEGIAGSGFRGSDNPLEGLEHLAGVTGGPLVNLASGDGATALDRVLRESASYYVATIDPIRSDRGRPHRVEVRVTRDGADVRARPEITFPEVDRMATRPVNPSPREMIRVSDVFHDLPLRATAYSAPSSEPGRVRVITLAEPGDDRAQITSLVAALFDREGRLIANWVATPADLARAPVAGAMLAEPGGYRLRVAAVDATGRAGTVDYELAAETVDAGPLRLSSIVLGLSRGGFVPKLQFAAEPVAIAQVEIAGGTPGARMSAALELAASVHGPPLATVPLTFTSTADGRFIASGAVPIGALPPGDYIVRAFIGVEGQPVARVVRTIRKQ